jgi:histidinol-phosphate aminotransferase
VEVDLSDNTNLWGPHPAALEVVRNAPPEVIARYPTVYATPLKEAVARRFGVGLENVTTGCGSDDLLDSSFRAAAFPPGLMSFPDPTFSMIEAFARMNGLESRPVPWETAMRDPLTLLARDPDLVYICRPNNPTGRSPSGDWVRQLLDAAGPSGPLVVLDEAYADYAQEDLVDDAVSSHRLLVLRTFSKLYGLAGLRVGVGIGPAHLIQEVEKSRGPYKVSQVAEGAAAAAMDDNSGWARGIVKETIMNREKLRGELEDRGLRPLPSEANFLLVPVGPGGGGGLKEGAIQIGSALKARGVAVRPFPRLPEIGDAIRVSIGPWALLERFLDAIDQLLEGGRAS